MDVGTHKERKSTFVAWIQAMRLRTLPLALAATFTGAFLAMEYIALNGVVLVMTALTTILLQINSNLANDYGDFSHGTDNDDRIGPERALQAGLISAKAMKNGIVVTSVLALLSGSLLLWVSPIEWWVRGLLFVLGVAAIGASINYTAGSNPYGYKGLGDVSVMAFFGILGVLGAFLCQVGKIEWDVTLAAVAIGGFSTGVLNINNTRDLASDQAAGKITLAVKMGPKNARRYHLILMLVAMLSFLTYAALHFELGVAWMFLLAYPLFALNAIQVFTNKDPKLLDPKLKQLALSTFVFSLLIGLGLYLA